MKFEHIRYKEIPLGSGEASVEDGPNALKLIFFNKDEKLRSHAVKHLTNLAEAQTTWKSLSSDQEKVVARTIKDLQVLGCPHIALKTLIPPCDRGDYRCKLYDLCTPKVKELEEIYLAAVRGFVEDAAKAPRLAEYFSDRDLDYSITLMPERPVAIKATLLDNQAYNLVTCYGGVDMSFVQMRDAQLAMIRNEARKKNITLHEEAAWGIGQGPADDFQKQAPAGESAAGEQTGKTKTRRARFRGGAQSWRRYLDSADEFSGEDADGFFDDDPQGY
ncbi:MAG: hypothetical protein QMD09_11425 [Desulfatibacillaceae bacterium]|nr:hypothetical protein [Desulfatibacillaceae bacterium]